MRLILLCALAFHGPLLLMQAPENTFDANFHMSMAEHYAHHWFNPWNEKSFAGFSQTTYPPLVHQWIAMLSHVVGLSYGFMIVQGIAILLLPVGIYGFARIWVSQRAASYAAFCSIFLGSFCQLVYQAGQIGTTSSTALFLLALPYAYRYVVRGEPKDIILGVCMACTAAAAHHATLLFGSVFFASPLIWLAFSDYRAQNPNRPLRVPIRRLLKFAALAGAAIFVMLLPYVAIMLKDPIRQIPIPHLSRSNYILQPKWGLHYWLIPWGALVLALPYIFYKGGERRLRPLLLGFYFALLFGLGGTTPVPRLLLGRAFEILTFERFTFWAILLALPFVGLLAVTLIDRFGTAMAGLLVVLIISSGAMGMAWNVYFPLVETGLDVSPVVNFLNSNGRDQYRYLTLGLANAMSKISCYTDAPSIDGEYNSARALPEMTKYGVGQLSTAKYYHSEGMTALSEMLKHAPKYGIKYIFVHDDYYNPILTFGGWRQVAKFSDGITAWTTLAVPKATKIPSPLEPPAWQGIMWGTIPFGFSILTIILVSGAVRKFADEPYDVPAETEPAKPGEPVLGAEPQEVAL